MKSETPTAWAVLCPEHGQVFLDKQDYLTQLSAADVKWLCPICKKPSNFDDENYFQNNAQAQRMFALDLLNAWRAQCIVLDSPYSTNEAKEEADRAGKLLVNQILILMGIEEE